MRAVRSLHRSRKPLPGREDDRRDLEAGGARRLDRQQRVADRAEARARGDDERQRELGGEVAHEVAAGERDEQAADALDHERVGVRGGAVGARHEVGRLRSSMPASSAARWGDTAGPKR